MKRIFTNGRYANVAATLALVMAMGGTSYAAYTLPHNSVGSTQIKPLAVKNSDIGASAVTSGKVRNGSLLAQDFAAGQLPQGAQGVAGPQGPSGQATAYARIDSTGNLISGQNFGFGSATSAHMGSPGSGIYCISGLPFTPRSALVSIDDTAAPALPVIAAVSTQTTAACGASGQVRITLTDITPAPTDQAFFIWLEK